MSRSSTPALLATGNFAQAAANAEDTALRCNNAQDCQGLKTRFFLCPGSGPARTYPRRFNREEIDGLPSDPPIFFETLSDLKLRKNFHYEETVTSRRPPCGNCDCPGPNASRGGIPARSSGDYCRFIGTG